jgi:hypothetical protein
MSRLWLIGGMDKCEPLNSSLKLRTNSAEQTMKGRPQLPVQQTASIGAVRGDHENSGKLVMLWSVFVSCY